MGNCGVHIVYILLENSENWHKKRHDQPVVFLVANLSIDMEANSVP